MTAPSAELPLQPASTVASQSDLTGRSRLVSNVLFSWAAHFVLIIAGFIMPRMIDHRLGQDLLGIWDFSWSLIGYFSLVQLGIGGSVSRYVARYRALGDTAAVNRAVSSAACMLSIVATVVVVLTVFLAWRVLPVWASSRLAGNLGTTRCVVLCLGLEVAVQVLFSCYSGVLTGCHRWKMYNSIQAGGYGLTVVGMIASLLLGGGLRSLALLHFAGAAGAFVCIAVAAHRVLPGLQVRLSLAKVIEAKGMFSFGLKSFVPQIGELLLNQTVAVLILAYLGPASLALYSRPRSLVHHIRVLISKMSSILIPSASSLQITNQTDEIRSVVVKGTRYAAYLTLPIVSVVAVMGGSILQLWMGPKYRMDLVPMMLAVGSAVVVILGPALSVIAGMNLHGLPGCIHFAGCTATVGAVWVGVAIFKFGIVGAAACASVPLMLIYTIYMPVYIAHHIGLPTLRFVRDAIGGPLLSTLLLIGSLLGARQVFRGSPAVGLLVGCVISAVLLTPVYWYCAIPASLKTRILAALGRILPAQG